MTTDAITLKRHPQFIGSLDDWCRYRDMYEGKHHVMSDPKYLWKADLENKSDGAELHAARMRRTRYLKLPEMIVSLWCSYFFKKAPRGVDGAQEFLKRVGADRNADGKRHGWIYFWREMVLAEYLTYGKVAVLCDSFREKGKSLLEEQTRGFRPYLSVIPALSMPDWQWGSDPERMGSLDWIRHEFDHMQHRADSTADLKISRRSQERALVNGQYRVRTFERKTDQNDDPKGAESKGWTLLDTQTVELAELPVVVLEDSQSWIDGVCEEALRYHNLRSNKDNIQYQQGYQRILAAGAKFDDEPQRKAASEYTIAAFPAETTITVIEPSDISGYERSCNEALACTFKVGLNQIRTLSSDSKSVQSDDTIAEEKKNTLDLAMSTIDDIEESMTASLRHMALMAGEERFKGRIEFDRRALERNFPQFVQAYTMFADALSPYPEVKKLAAIEAVRAMGLSEQDEADAIAAIEEGPEVPERPTLVAMRGAVNADDEDEAEDDGGQEAATA